VPVARGSSLRREVFGGDASPTTLQLNVPTHCIVGYTHDFVGMFHVEQLARSNLAVCTSNGAIRPSNTLKIIERPLRGVDFEERNLCAYDDTFQTPHLGNSLPLLGLTFYPKRRILGSNDYPTN
jgi:hypothetical protein